MGALREEDGFLAGRILFQRSLLDPTLWHYGYLLTHPDFRRRSLGRRLMEVGLSELLRRGARWGACYVASDNTSSLRLNARMGYLESGIVRAHVEAGQEEPGDLRILTLPERDLRRAEGGCSALVADLFGQKRVPLVAEEFLGRSSLLPFKGSPFELLRIERAGTPLGFVRLGGGVANAILSPAAFEGDLWRRALSAVRRARDAARFFLFARREDREAAFAAAPYDHVLVLEDLRARPTAD